jgi:prepilin-type N-terminal cleavage/methylation domain-containing protein
MPCSQNSRKSGFSLVELSIVLVILGLLTGGILGGQALIKAAELRAIGEEYEKWHTAVYTFRDKYLALPGDMPNATQFWGAVNTGGTNNNCSDPTNDVGTGTQTCNGEGDGAIDLNYEKHRFWQHLANAGLINGEFTGAAGSAGNEHSVFDENAPRSKYGNMGWSVGFRGTDAGNTYFFANDYGHVYYFGAQHFVSAALDPGLAPADAWNIDTKFDDGMPARGNVIAHWWGICTNAANQNDTDADYDLQEENPSCSLIFKKAA